jgi:hypothetical protein
MKNLNKVIKLLQRQDYEDELLTKVLPCVPNMVQDYVILMFNGWNVKLHPDGTWTVEDTSK